MADKIELGPVIPKDMDKKDYARLLDTILLILLVSPTANINYINLELRRCGFFVTHLELTKVLEKLRDDGLININDIEGAD